VTGRGVGGEVGRRAAVSLLALFLVVCVVAVAARADRRELEARAVVNAITARFGAGPLGACFWRIAWRESRLDPHAVDWHDVHADGSRGSFGALQIGALWRRPGETVAAFARRMLDPAANVAVAARLYRRFGLAPWGGSC
jgi:hypothetical protein